MASVKLQRQKTPVFATMGLGMLYGCAFLALLALWNGSAFTYETRTGYVISILYLGFVSSAIGYACYVPLLEPAPAMSRW
jgi:drug/metabolite transporter (DMT)-like permease